MMNKYEKLLEQTCVQNATGFSRTNTAHIVDFPHPATIQFLDIKALNDLSAFYRERLHDLIQDYRVIVYGRDETLIRSTYVNHELIIIRRQISDLWKVYRTLMTDRHALTRSYMGYLNSSKEQASFPTEKRRPAAV